ncbi:MAG: hypothetical protein KDC18_22130, partial [Alphaproteobacteria bacterium]|nr:hypothetical protein [Alphaproteobacteria bacterium]
MAQIAAAPVPIAVDDAFATDEDTGFSGNVLDGSLSGGSPDTDPGNAPTVTAVNGNAAGLGHAIALPSGARLTLNGDGSFSYDPNGAFDDLPGPASGASNLTGTDSFTYELNGSDTATVTATVNGVDSNGDVLLGTAGADALDGGIGSNVASYANATGAVTANLANPAANTGAAAG